MPVVIGMFFIHFGLSFIRKEYLVRAYYVILFSGICGIVFCYYINKGNSRFIQLDACIFEAAYCCIAFALCGYILFFVVSKMYGSIAQVKYPVVKILLILLPFFFLVLICSWLFLPLRKLIINGQYKFRYYSGLFHGRAAAVTDLNNNRAVLYTYGLARPWELRYDIHTGLKQRAAAGCCVTFWIEGYVKGYNKWVRNAYGRFGSFKNSKQKFNNIIVNPLEYFQDESQGKIIKMNIGQEVKSQSGTYTAKLVGLNDKSGRLRFILSNHLNQVDVWAMFKRDHKITLKWGPEKSGLIFIRIAPVEQMTVLPGMRTELFVVDVNDGSSLNKMLLSETRDERQDKD